MPDLDALDRFALVVETGNFSAAARRLKVSRQAIQRSIDGLERRHGVQLFERTTRTLRLTDAGRRLSRVALAVRQAGREAEAILTSATESPRGLIRLSAPPLFADEVLAHAIPDFLRRFPEVRIEARFVAARTDPLTDDLDVALRIGAAPPDNAYAVRIGQGLSVLCAASDYLAGNGTPTHPDQLVAHHLLAYGRGQRRWSFTGPEGDVSIAVEPRLMTDSARVMVEAARAGLGILKVPRMAARQALDGGSLVRVLPEWDLAPADVWAVYGHRTSGDPTLAAFLDALRGLTWGAS